MKEETKQKKEQEAISEAVDKETMKSLLEEVKNATADLKEAVLRGEKLREEGIIGGNTEAGTKRKELTEDEKDKQYINKFLESTGLRIE